jgi:maltooligosyltrehalose trehalohydrolase
MTERKHLMPFGSRILDDGRVRFRLWAPAAETVELSILGLAPEADIAMGREDNGWFGIVTELAAGGTYYQFRIDGELKVSDPASRFQPQDVHGPSQVIDPCQWQWQDADWRGRPWEETVIYELHVGTFTPQGTFRAVIDKLDYLVDLGVTAIELMPVADFPGKRNWGYDGVLLFAPDSQYGTPDDLKALIQAAHLKGLMVFLDVVYNHFGPEGNYLHRYASAFFTKHHHTPWGDAINFDDAYSGIVRQFFVHNALYWLEEFHFDGLRFDSAHAIFDDTKPQILEEIAQAVQQEPGYDRHIHLVLENDDNSAHYLQRLDDGRPRYYVAQWNDDIHHALHVILTGESDGYYADYAENPFSCLGRCLSEGFAYQGEVSPYRNGKHRGELSENLPPGAFVAFLQNHDQIGNRAFGERIHRLAEDRAVRAASEILLLLPAPILLFMGQEWHASTPFPYFCDFEPKLNKQVEAGRKKEFAKFTAFSKSDATSRIPSPVSEETFKSAKLKWDETKQPGHDEWLSLHRTLLHIRQHEIVPRLHDLYCAHAGYEMISTHCISAHWKLGDGVLLQLTANLSGEDETVTVKPRGKVIYASSDNVLDRISAGKLPPWSVIWLLETGAG